MVSSPGDTSLHIGVQGDFQPSQKANPAFHVQNLAALRKHLPKKGISVIDKELLQE